MYLYTYYCTLTVVENTQTLYMVKNENKMMKKRLFSFLTERSVQLHEAHH